MPSVSFCPSGLFFFFFFACMASGLFLPLLSSSSLSSVSWCFHSSPLHLIIRRDRICFSLFRFCFWLWLWVFASLLSLYVYVAT